MTPIASPDPSFWAGKQVLITGHTGVVGGWLALWLRALGADPVGIAQPPHPDCGLYVTARVGESCGGVFRDIRDPAVSQRLVSETRPQVVLHAAALTDADAAAADPTAALEIAALGAAHLLDALASLGGSTTMVLLSHHAVYGARDAARESDALAPVSAIGAAAAAAEQAATARRWIDGAAAVGAARLGPVLGAGDLREPPRHVADDGDRAGSALLRAALTAQQPPAAALEARRGWISALDAACGVLLYAEDLARRPEDAPRAVNFAGGPAQQISGADAFALMRAETGDASGPAPAAERGDAVDPPRSLFSGLSKTPSRGASAGSSGDAALSIDLAENRLGWRPRLTGAQAARAAADWAEAWRAGAEMRAASLSGIAAFAEFQGEPDAA